MVQVGRCRQSLDLPCPPSQGTGTSPGGQGRANAGLPTSVRTLVAPCRLQQCGIKCVKLQGSQSMDQRDTMIEAFTHDPDVKIFLMSLKAGGELLLA